MNKFFITGIPRSGTTVLTKTLSRLGNVYVYKNNNEFFEPFGQGSTKQYLDPYQPLIEAEEQCNSKYFGFKCFIGDTVDIKKLNQELGYKPFVIIRKDIWKAVFSHYVAKTASFREKINIFDRSSTLHPNKDIINNTNELRPGEANFLKLSYFKTLKACYDFETQWKNIDIIYFEDLIKPNASFDCLNEYFGQKIIFNLDYDDSHEINSYILNWSTSVLNALSNDLINTAVIPDNCPDYIKESMYKFIK